MYVVPFMQLRQLAVFDPTRDTQITSALVPAFHDMRVPLANLQETVCYVISRLWPRPPLSVPEYYRLLCVMTATWLMTLEKPRRPTMISISFGMSREEWRFFIIVNRFTPAASSSPA